MYTKMEKLDTHLHHRHVSPLPPLLIATQVYKQPRSSRSSLSRHLPCWPRVLSFPQVPTAYSFSLVLADLLKKVIHRLSLIFVLSFPHCIYGDDLDPPHQTYWKAQKELCCGPDKSPCRSRPGFEAPYQLATVSPPLHTHSDFVTGLFGIRRARVKY